MGNKFMGFGVMAAAFAAAGLGMQAPAVAALAVMGLKFVLFNRNGYRFLAQEVAPGIYRRRGEWAESYPASDDPRAVVEEVVYAASWEAIGMDIRIKQSAYLPGGESGWLDREGNYYPCQYHGHSDLAETVLFSSYAALEKAGWVHVDEKGRKGSYTFRVNGSTNQEAMTPAQLEWLEKNGHDLDPSGEKARKREAEKIQIGEYNLDAGADNAAFERQMRQAGLDPDKFRKPQGKSRLADFR